MKTITATVRVSFKGSVKCYACDADAVGACDRRTHYSENAVVPACERHAVPGSALRVLRVCGMCGGAWRKGGEYDGTETYHAACYRAACAD